MIINILIGIILLLVTRVYLIQSKVGRRLMTLEQICGSNESKREMIRKNLRWKKKIY